MIFKMLMLEYFCSLQESSVHKQTSSSTLVSLYPPTYPLYFHAQSFNRRNLLLSTPNALTCWKEYVALPHGYKFCQYKAGVKTRERTLESSLWS